jgi:hypothetical protein
MTVINHHAKPLFSWLFGINFEFLKIILGSGITYVGY